jgi:hypothetical protein
MCDNKCLKCIHTAVLPILVTAEKYDGYAYGEYVRQVIPKVMLNDFSSCDIKILRLWFSEINKRDAFLGVVKGITKYSDDSMSVVDIAGDIVLTVGIITGAFPKTLWFAPDALVYYPSTNSLHPMTKMSLTAIMNRIRTKTTTVTKANTDSIIDTLHDEPRDMLKDGWTIFDHLGNVLRVTEANTLAFVLPKVEDEQTPIESESGITQAA